jgi:hypothetical protein
MVSLVPAGTQITAMFLIDVLVFEQAETGRAGH